MEMEKHVILRDSSGLNLGESPRVMAFRIGEIPEIRVESADLSKAELEDLRRAPDVVDTAPVMPIKLIEPKAKGEASEDTGSQTGVTWGVMATGADTSPFTGKGVKVAVLDTGIDPAHPAFSGVIIEEQDFTGEGNGDRHGHGTHVAGTVFGQTVNNCRFGVAQGIAKALIGKVLDSHGSGSTEGIYYAIQWAAFRGAHIISMSLGMDFPGLVASLIQRGWPEDLATSKGLEAYRSNVRFFEKLAEMLRVQTTIMQPTVLVAASGNESKREIDPNYEISASPPSAADGIISVGALKTSGAPHDSLEITDFSNTGVNVCAPGQDVFSSVPGGRFASWAGTSMATPHVAGVAALWAEKMIAETDRTTFPLLTGRIIGAATRGKLEPGYDGPDVGAGIVQAPQS